MKKTILALTIASSVVLLTGCDAEDDTVKYFGPDIDTPTKAKEYATNVKMMNELIIENVITNCSQADKNYCTLSSKVKDQNNTDIYVEGEVKLSRSNGLTTIETSSDKSIKLEDGNDNKVLITATFTNDNHHKITFKQKNTNSNDYAVTFNGQYMDKDGKQFQSHSTVDFTYITTTNNLIDKNEVATLEGKKHTPTWTWTIEANDSVAVHKD